MSLNVAMNVALSGLFANQSAIAATSENIANVNTENYARRETTFYADAIPDQFAGVNVEIARTAVDRFLQSASYAGAASAAQSTAVSDSLSRVEKSLGAPGENISYSNLLDEAYASLTLLAANPSSLAGKADALSTLDAAFGAFARTRDAIAAESAAATDRLGIDLNRANALLADIYRLNAVVPDSPGAADMLDARLSELAKLMSISVTRNDLGQVTVAAADGTVIASAQGYSAFNMVPGAPLRVSLASVDASSGAASVTVADFSAGFSSGEIRGLLDLVNVELPRLDGVVRGAADGVASELNAAYAQNSQVGSASPTTDALLIADADGDYAVNAALLSDPSRFAIARPSSGAAGLNDGSGAAALADVASSQASRDVVQSIALLGSAARNAELKASTDKALSAELSARVSAQAGVNLDEELSNLILFQRAYSANARVIAAVDELWQSLLSIL
jgi:flagellar hook-associated protein 1 FlgK